MDEDLAWQRIEEERIYWEEHVMSENITVKHSQINSPFLNDATHVYLESDEGAISLGFPEGGRWARAGDRWELTIELPHNLRYEHDDSKCSECQGWGAPNGCRTCATTSMGG